MSSLVSFINEAERTIFQTFHSSLLTVNAKNLIKIILLTPALVHGNCISLQKHLSFDAVCMPPSHPAAAVIQSRRLAGERGRGRGSVRGENE
jgi:hypothetical protein